jgi:hypothetical protein
LNHRNRFIGVEVWIFFWRSEAEQRCSSACGISTSDMPPWTLWSQKDTDHNWDWPDPLYRKRNSVSPLVRALNAGSIDARSNELTHHPTPVFDQHALDES